MSLKKDRDFSSKKTPLPFINRELAWLSFNERVLQEAADPSTPLLERLKFLGIYSNNLDEFYRVRVASVKRMLSLGKEAKTHVGILPEQLLEEISKTVISQQKIFEEIYQKILKELGKNNIQIINEQLLNKEQQEFVVKFFNEEVLSNLFPILTDNDSVFPYLNDNSSYLFAKLSAESNPKKTKYALIELPTKTNSRFVVLPNQGHNQFIIMLDDVVRFCANDIFKVLGYSVCESYNIKLTRDAELQIDNDLTQSLIAKIAKSLKKREKGKPVRLVVDSAISKEMLTFLMNKLKLGKRDQPIPGGRYHNFKDFINFPSLGTKELVYKYPKELRNPYIEDPHVSILKMLQQRDLFLVYPYNTYDHIIALLREASVEPTVVSIQISIYRIASASKIANALINALKNGKKVIVIVELQARFDEENNIFWANKLKDEGAQVIFGDPHLKIHAKLFLITAKEKGNVVQYAHVGTGNFNEKTAKIYTDASLLTCDKRITQEIEQVFEFLANKQDKINFTNLAVAPFDMRKKIYHLLDKEISNAKNGKEAWAIIKINHLVDQEMITKLYKASQEGVKIKLIIRGMCSLACGVPEISENIEGVSIVDKYLEHIRLFIFANDNAPLYYISSGDWMTRNLDFRCEVAIPIYNEKIKATLKAIVDIQLADNTKSRILDAKLSNTYVKIAEGNKAVRSQEEIYQYLVQQRKIILTGKGGKPKPS
jgi:polyphosphate kinase